MKQRQLLATILCLTLVSLILVPACSGNTSPQTKEPIKVGFLTSYTGPFASYGPPMEDGLKLKLDEVKYQFNGRPIKLIVEDDASDAAVALEKVKKLVTVDKIDVLIGPISSPNAAAIAPYIVQSKLPAIGTGTKPYQTSTSGAFILPHASLYQVGMVLGWYAWDQLGYKTLTTVGTDAANGREALAGVADMFKQRGGQVVQQQWIKPTEIDYGPYLTSLQKADGLVDWLSGGELQFMKQYKDFGVKTPQLIISIDTISSEQFRQLGDVALSKKGSMQYSPLLDNAANKQFVSAIRAKYQRPPGFQEQCTYIAGDILLRALEATGGDTAYDKLFPAMLKLKFDSAQGPLSFEPTGLGIVTKYIGEVKVVNGEYLLNTVFDYKDVRYSGPK